MPSTARSLTLPLTTAALLIAAPLPSTASAQSTAAPDTPAWQRPGYQFLRFNENWSVLANKPDSAPADYWDPVKYIPLGDAGDTWLSVGGHMRARVENWNNFNFGAPVNDDDTFLLWRLALHADLHVGEGFRAFVEGKSALSTDRDLPGGHRTLDVDTGALEQAFVDMKFDIGDDAHLTIRPGRRALLFGKQRLVSPLPWGNTLRRWDGVSAILNVGAWRAEGFWTQFVPTDKYGFNDPNHAEEFFGVYANGPIGETRLGMDLYWLGRHRDMAGFNGTAGAEHRHTFGARVGGPVGEHGFEFDVEGAWQTGSLGAGDINAWMFASEIAWRFSNTGWKPRVKVGFDYASGDDGAGGDVETFDQLYPLGHAYLGYMDFIGRQNIMDLSAGVSVAPTDKVTLSLDGHYFRLADDSDALYHAGGGVLRAAMPGADEDVGFEIDLTLNWRIDRHIGVLLGYSHFFAGDFLEDTGAHEDADFVYVEVQYTF